GAGRVPFCGTRGESDANSALAGVRRAGGVPQAGGERAAVAQLVVGMADCRVAAAPDEVLATVALGACIGLSMYDCRAGVGGMLHYMLPDSTIDPARGRLTPCMFADLGIPLLVERMRAKGAHPRNLVAHAAGGASIMDPNNIFDIGKRN